MKNSILIICNGKSVSQIDWEWLKRQKNLDTFAMNAAYKTFEKLDFYPTYYSNLDNIVIQSHSSKVQQLLSLNKIKKMYLHSCCSFEGTYQPIKKVFPITKEISDDFSNFNSWMNTGSDSVQISIMMGYKQIYVIGVDGYVEMIPEAERKEGIVLEIKETPKDNPNYWFNEYQEKGERYQLPNAQKAHVPGWNKAKNYCKDNNIKLINLSNNDYVDLEKMSYNKFVNLISTKIFN